MAEDDNTALLALLNAHCSQALGQVNEDGRARKRRRLNSSMDENESEHDSDDTSEEEWRGLGSDLSQNEEGEEEEEEEGFSVVEDDDLDDEFRADSTLSGPTNIVVFSESKKNTSFADKAQMKAFMSSKVSKLRVEESSNATSKRKLKEGEDDEERTNRENDALLHKLVHTKLLSGSLDRSLDMKPADRRKALAGRVMELAAETKLGKGEKAVRNVERNKASKRVREGLIQKQKHRQELQKEEAKNLGNYHPSLKRLFEDEPKSSRPKRDRGLRMGVGTFSGGVLKLKDEDVRKTIGQHPGGSSRGKLGGKGKQKASARKRP